MTNYGSRDGSGGGVGRPSGGRRNANRAACPTPKTGGSGYGTGGGRGGGTNRK